MQPFAGNYINYNKYEKTNWLCTCMERVESEDHLISGSCVVFGDLVPKGSDMRKSENLVILFNAILERRDMPL